jgi:hypothetical protein
MTVEWKLYDVPHECNPILLDGENRIVVPGHILWPINDVDMLIGYTGVHAKEVQARP